MSFSTSFDRPLVVGISKIFLNNKNYYFVEDVKNTCPAFFYGCAKSSRMIVDKRKISSDNYTYATYAPKTLKWKQSDNSIKSAKLLLTCEWVEQNVPGWKSDNGNVTNDAKLDLDIVPPLLQLKDEEKFKDENGNIVEIETRGIKTFDGIFFSGKDVEKMLNLTDVSRLILNENSSYEKDIHYKKFIRKRLLPEEEIANEIGNPTKMYLTYFGLVKMLITTKNKIAENFQKWALKTLFTIQMGDEIEKEELGTNILNINLETYRNVFKSHSSKMPCVYLLEIGKVKELKDTFNINEDDEILKSNSTIYKFGFTDDIDRRLNEHFSDYGKLKNVKNIQLTKFTMVEERYKVEAERDLRKFFEDFNKRFIVKTNKELNIKGRNELIILNKDELESVFKFYRLLGIDYAGSSLDLQNKLEKLKDEYEKDMLRKEMKIQDLEHTIKYKELELKCKDMEIELLKRKLSQ
jgi:hypothetical protein